MIKIKYKNLKKSKKRWDSLLKIYKDSFKRNKTKMYN